MASHLDVDQGSRKLFNLIISLENPFVYRFLETMFKNKELRFISNISFFESSTVHKSYFDFK